MESADLSVQPVDKAMFAWLLEALPLTVVYALGFMTLTELPVWVGSMAEAFGASVSSIGTISSIELGAIAISSIFAAAFVDTTRLRWPVAAGIVAVIAANLCSVVAPSLMSFAITRVAAGVASGFLLADINRRAAKTSRPQRIFASQIFVMVVLAVLFFGFVPQLMAQLGPRSPFHFIAFSGVLVLVSLIWLPVFEGGASSAAVERRLSINVGALSMLLAPSLLFLTNMGIWTYLNPAAARAGVGLNTLASLLAFGALLNLCAPLISGYLADRRGSRLLLVSLGLATFAACIFFVAGTGNATLFAIGVLFQPFFVMFLVPFYLGRLVEFDPTGKFIGASSAFLMGGAAIGPGVGGFIIERAGLPNLALSGLAMLILIFVISCVGFIRQPALQAA